MDVCKCVHYSFDFCPHIFLLLRVVAFLVRIANNTRIYATFTLDCGNKRTYLHVTLRKEKFSKDESTLRNVKCSHE